MNEQHVCDKAFECDDWANLHPDLLNEFVKHIDSYDDYLRVRTICKRWNLELPKIPKHMKNPWLQLPFDDESVNRRPLYNVAEKKIYHLELPETQKTLLYGSYYGWLITIGIEDGALQILNPITRASFDLPPISTFPDVTSYQPNRLGEEYKIINDYGHEYNLSKIYMHKKYIDKVILSLPPNQCDDNCMAIYGSKLAYCGLGDSSWTDFPMPQRNDRAYVDAIFHEGKVYAVDRKAQAYEFDIETKY